ncbi:hypothetical protein PVIIG_05443 [Plasmodium vivax India VII]|uniref:Uncharacterized protein n=1 Tax=Plasmodium vivax India VII TaxID=1077284 RepID=A0A0J9UUE6_PLAVI|nr:hypothetical protein PVIIG_05443 [Plasmodium vivax India VII]
MTILVEWKKKYSFLKDLWELYDKFNESANVNDYNAYKFMLCDNLPKNDIEPTAEHINSCKKIVKNLYSLYEDAYPNIDTIERCRILNNTLYKEIDNHSIPEPMLDTIFKESFARIKGVSERNKMCLHSPIYKEINDPEKMIHLYNFLDNMDTIEKNLIETNHENHCSCKRFLLDCVNIYNEMNKKYCTERTYEGQIKKETCPQLNEFSITYNAFRASKSHVSHKIPNLTESNDEYLSGCTFKENEQESSLRDNSGNSITKGVTTTVGAMAGISSVLTLLYKVNTNFHMRKTSIKCKKFL